MQYQKKDDYMIYIISSKNKDDSECYEMLMDGMEYKDDEIQQQNCKNILDALIQMAECDIKKGTHISVKGFKNKEFLILLFILNPEDKSLSEIEKNFEFLFKQNNWKDVYIEFEDVEIDEDEDEDEYDNGDEDYSDTVFSKMEVSKNTKRYYIVPHLNSIFNHIVPGRLCKYRGKYLIQTTEDTDLDEFYERIYPDSPVDIIYDNLEKLKGGNS